MLDLIEFILIGLAEAANVTPAKEVRITPPERTGGMLALAIFLTLAACFAGFIGCLYDDWWPRIGAVALAGFLALSSIGIFYLYYKSAPRPRGFPVEPRPPKNTP